MTDYSKLIENALDKTSSLNKNKACFSKKDFEKKKALIMENNWKIISKI